MSDMKLMIDLLQIGVYIIVFIMIFLNVIYFYTIGKSKTKKQKTNKQDNYDDYIENSEKFENEEEDEDNPIKRL